MLTHELVGEVSGLVPRWLAGHLVVDFLAVELQVVVDVAVGLYGEIAGSVK